MSSAIIKADMNGLIQISGQLPPPDSLTPDMMAQFGKAVLDIAFTRSRGTIYLEQISATFNFDPEMIQAATISYGGGGGMSRK